MEKSLFLKGHSLNLLASFFLGAVNLSHRGVGLSIAFSLEGTNSTPGEFILHFGESLISLENRLCCYLPYCVPFTEFIPVG